MGGDRLQASSLCLGRGKVLLREELLWRLMMPPQVQCRFVQGIHILSKLARTATVVNKLQDVFGTVFTNTELSETLTEIVKMDLSFEKEQFLKDCEKDIIPNVLEAITRGGAWKFWKIGVMKLLKMCQVLHSDKTVI